MEGPLLDLNQRSSETVPGKLRSDQCVQFTRREGYNDRSHCWPPGAAYRAGQMAYTTLMVYFDGTPGAHARLRVAVELADRFRATLIGIAGPPYLPSSERGMLDALGKIESEFRAGAKHIQTVEWRGQLVWATTSATISSATGSSWASKRSLIPRSRLRQKF